jgi:hypothetical protein
MPVENSKIDKGYELNVYLSNKVKNGSVKVSEKDLTKLKVGIVEDVIITSAKNSETIQLMLFSDSKIKPGNIIMSVSDSQGINVEEGDKVTVKKASIVKKPPINSIKTAKPNLTNNPSKNTNLKKTNKVIIKKNT